MTTSQNSVYSDCLDVSFNIFNVTVGINIFEDQNKLPLGKIKMSPQTAKAFSRVLKENITQYEEIYGPIQEYTPEILEKEREMDAKLKELAAKRKDDLQERKDAASGKKILDLKKEPKEKI